MANNAVSRADDGVGGTVRGSRNRPRAPRRSAAVWISALGVLAVTALLPQVPRLAPAGGGSAGPAGPAGPTGTAQAGGPTGERILVVQANLQDAVRAADATDRADLDNFAGRLLRATPQPPDALLLTEILGPGARHLANRLSKATRQPYRVAVDPGDEVFLPDGSIRESAILINSRRLETVDAGGFARVQNEDQAVQVVRRKGERLRFPLIAGHISGEPVAAVTALEEILRAKSAGTAEDRMATAPVIAADFRHGRCARPMEVQPVDCAPHEFWSRLTTELAYTDAGFETSTAAGERRLTGYLFAGGRVHDGDVDTAYAGELPEPAECKRAFDAGRARSAPERCRATYYADQPFTWAVIGAREPLQHSVAPDRIVLGRCELATRLGAVIARTVNNTGTEQTAAVRATGAPPVAVSPESATLTAPPARAAGVAIRLSAPRDAAPGDYVVRVRVASSEVPVRVTIPPGECVEPPAYASTFNPGFPPENAVDGDINTFWHSEFSPPAPLPQSITVNLGAPREVTELRYRPRFDGNLNGTISRYTIYVSADGTAFERVADGTWPIDAREKIATFDPVTARYVRLEATASSGGSFASAAEVSAR
jgi:hypothetical protein